MTQRELFERFTEPLAKPNRTVAADDLPRVERQIDQVLDMLRSGPVHGAEFVAAGILRYSARIGELREAGHRIVSQHCSGGDWMFYLQENNK